MYTIEAVANSVKLQLYLLHALYIIIFKVQCKLYYIASRSAPSTPLEKSLVPI